MIKYKKRLLEHYHHARERLKRAVVYQVPVLITCIQNASTSSEDKYIHVTYRYMLKTQYI